MTVRSFLAFPVSGVLKEKFKQILDDLQHTHADVKWVKLENIHLTLKFLGGLEENEIENVSSIVQTQCRRFSPFTSYLSEIGAFPDLRHPKIVWGALDPKKEFDALVEVLDEQLAKYGIAKNDHPFKPHITLGRVRTSAHLKDLVQAMQQIPLEDKTGQTFERIILYKSTLTPQGPDYEVLKEFEIGKP